MKKLLTAAFMCLAINGMAQDALAPLDASWHLVWHDEFDGTGPLDTLTWTAERGFVRNEEYQWYQPQTA